MKRSATACLLILVIIGGCSGDDRSGTDSETRALERREQELDKREQALDRRAEWLDKRAAAITARAAELRESEREKRARMAVERAVSEWARMKQAAQRFVGIVRLGALKLESDQRFTNERGIQFARELRVASARALSRLLAVQFPPRYRRSARVLRAEIARLHKHSITALKRCGIANPSPLRGPSGGDGSRSGDQRRNDPPDDGATSAEEIRPRCRAASIPMVGFIRRVRDALEQVTPLT